MANSTKSANSGEQWQKVANRREGGSDEQQKFVSALNSGSSSPGSRPGQGHGVVFMGKTLDFHSASLHPGVINGYQLT